MTLDEQFEYMLTEARVALHRVNSVGQAFSHPRFVLPPDPQLDQLCRDRLALLPADVSDGDDEPNLRAQIESILREMGESGGSAGEVESALTERGWTTGSTRPRTVVASTLSRLAEDDDSPVERVVRGRYRLLHPDDHPFAAAAASTDDPWANLPPTTNEDPWATPIDQEPERPAPETAQSDPAWPAASPAYSDEPPF